MAQRTRKHLWDQTCKQAKPKDRPYKLSDGEGMYLYVTPQGGKLWRINYRFEKKSKTASLGPYPGVSLEAARELRREFRHTLSQGIDPMAHYRALGAARAAAQEDLFEAVARDWLEKRSGNEERPETQKRPRKWTKRYADLVKRLLERDVFPYVGRIPIRDVKPTDLMPLFQAIEARGTLDILADVRSIVSRVFRHAVAQGKADRDVSADLRDAFPRHEGGHYAALRPDELPAFLKALNGHKPTSNREGFIGIKLILLTLVRSSELRKAEWAEFKLDGKEPQWVVPEGRMKMRQGEHVVPLSRQAVALLKELKEVTAHEKYLFPTRKMKKSEFASGHIFLRALAVLGYKGDATIHGMRTTTSSDLHESEIFESLVIERQLAHKDKDKVRGIYNKAHYLKKRRKMVQWWADHLEKLAAKKA